MRTTKLFKNGNSQAIRIPAELAYESWNLNLLIERKGDEIRIRPVPQRLTQVMVKLSAFSSDFMAQGRGDDEQASRAML